MYELPPQFHRSQKKQGETTYWYGMMGYFLPLCRIGGKNETKQRKNTGRSLLFQPLEIEEAELLFSEKIIGLSPLDFGGYKNAIKDAFVCGLGLFLSLFWPGADKNEPPS